MQPSTAFRIISTSTDRRQSRQVNSQDVRRRNQAQFLGQGDGTGRDSDPEAEWCAFAMFSGPSYETLEALIIGTSDFVPKLIPFGTDSFALGRITPKPWICPRRDDQRPTLLARSTRDNTPMCVRGASVTVVRLWQALESAFGLGQFPSRVGVHHRMYILVDTVEDYFGENSNSDASAMGQ